MSVLSILADVHIAARPELTMGIDTQAQFSRVVGHLRTMQPDHVVLLGDYSIKAPIRQDVEWVRSRILLADAPVEAIAGNHDTSRDVAEVFGIDQPVSPRELYYRRDFGRQRALFLDTSAGRMSAEQRDWLHMEIRNSRERTLVFMHHPPIHMGVPFMDQRYSFQDDSREVYNLLFGGPVPVHVFCGHYHTARTTHVGVHTIHLCPSTYFQIDAASSDFRVAHTMPGMRHVELLDGELRTWVEFLAPDTVGGGVASES